MTRRFESNIVKMKGLLLATIALCVGLCLSDDESLDLSFFSSSWPAGKPKPMITLYSQATTHIEKLCKSTKCEVQIAYRKVESKGAKDLEGAPEFTKLAPVDFNKWIEDKGLIPLENLEAGALYQVRIRPKINERLGPVRDFFIRTVASEKAAPITKYKRGFEKRVYEEIAIKSKLMELLEKVLQ